MKTIFLLNTSFCVEGLPAFENQEPHATLEGANAAKQQFIDALGLIPSIGNYGLLEPKNPNTMTYGLYSVSVESKEILA